ncbi:hypothetical protein [Planococcus lenghuensis]|uniref:Uncharacterized protein n=1 Tax=Planococcus lenghuensis TaxID=2213202 RepID=A0A1Q2L453_9BACL|nr:hypothetical protein [Planococcus lenghuensis]AQQ55201.1 hypothetical protein B0X71_17640 [Planococcus lenghuensis]
MSQQKPLPIQSVSYFFTRAKDTHQEGGRAFITLFVRLTKEHTKYTSTEIQRETESAWADIQEVPKEQAAHQITMLPDGLYTYVIAEEMYHELLRLSAACPEALCQLTPIHRNRKFKRFG